METFTLILNDPKRKVVIEKAEELTVTTSQGERTLLSHHIDRIANLSISERKVKYNNAWHSYAISGGSLSFNQKKNEAILCLSSFEEDKDIDLARAERAQKEAEERLKEQLSFVEQQKFQIRLERAINRIKVKNIDK